MRNRYLATCYRCGEKVPPGDGEFFYQSDPRLRWPGFPWPGPSRNNSAPLVQHDACAIKYNGTNTHYLYAPDGDDGQVIE